jgi:hypothetical protein
VEEMEATPLLLLSILCRFLSCLLLLSRSSMDEEESSSL